MSRSGKAWGLASPQISLGSSHLPKTTWSGCGSTRNWTQSCRTPRLMVLNTLLSCLLRWTSHLSRPPDCSYNCSLLFQGDFLDCSGPVMFLIPSFLHPSYPAAAWSLWHPVSFPSPPGLSLLWLSSLQENPDRTLPPTRKSWAKSSSRFYDAAFLTIPVLEWAPASVSLPKNPKNCGIMGVRQAWFTFCPTTHSSTSSLASPNLSFSIC